MNVCHIATIAAYPLKAGGFRGAYLPAGSKERVASEVLESLEAARHWAQSEAFKRHGADSHYALAALRRRGEYQANVWVSA